VDVAPPPPGVPAPSVARARHLRLRDFRNLAFAELEIPESGFALVGDNGHGKTNLLEAIAYLHALRSVRGARDVDLVRFGAPAFHVAADCAGVPSDHVAVGFEKAARRKRVMLDGAPPPRLSDALGAVPSVTFSPRDVELVAGSPAERRRYLDVLLALSSPRYLAALQLYRAALVRRNATLRAWPRPADMEARLHAWDVPLANAGAELHCARRHWLAEFAPRFAELSVAIGEAERAELRYASGLLRDGELAAERAVVRDALLAALAHQRDSDLRRGLTHAGPHRDDLELRLAGRPLRRFGSAGQQRGAAIALRLLECETLRTRVGREPILLLDDPFAELDRSRAARVLALMTSSRAGQTLLAVPRPDDVPPELTGLAHWTIRDGVVSAGGETSRG
jgi:DNA replication and repair protein RecF